MKYFLTIFIFFTIISSTLNAQFEQIRISNPLSVTPEEVTIAINPNNPLQLAAGANIRFFYASEDGGKTWTQKNMNSTLGVWGDPCVVYDTEGNLFFGHLSNPSQGGYWIDRIVVQKSTDNGVNWNDGAGIGYSFPKVQDKEWLAVDVTDSPYRNNLYTSWTEFDKYNSSFPGDSSRILFSKSTDAGETWSEALRISDVGGDCLDEDNTVEGAVPAIGPDGEIYVSWAGPLGLMFDKSTNGGESFGKDIFVADIPGGWDYSVPGISRCNGLPVTCCDISKSEYRGNIYITWSDQRNGTDDTDIYFVKSTDKGETWSEPLRVNNDLTTRHQFFVWMTVDSTNGNIYSVFYDRRNTTGLDTDVYLARSSDGGRSFKNFKISSNSFTPTASVFFGDYTNIAAHNGKIYPIWMRMDNIDLSVWTALIDDDQLVTAVSGDENMSPENFNLMQNYPNPFNPTTTISFSVPVKTNVTLEIYSVLGEKIRTLVNKVYSPGVYEIEFNGSDIPSGSYIYKLITPEFEKSNKMMLVK